MRLIEALEMTDSKTYFDNSVFGSRFHVIVADGNIVDRDLFSELSCYYNCDYRYIWFDKDLVDDWDLV